MFRSLATFAGSMIAAAGGAFVDFLAPATCPICHLPPEKQPAHPLILEICTLCERQIAPEIAHECPRCGAPSVVPISSHDGCAHCHGDHFDFRRVIRLGVYDGAMSALCLRLKSQSNGHLATATADLLWKRESAALIASRVDLVLPVPRHWTQYFGGRAHAPTYLARRLARWLRVDFDPRTLAKKRRTVAQRSLTPRQRRRNLRNAFGVRGAWTIKKSRILLVDDILTTGSTAQECTKALLTAGAAEVTVAVIARGLGR